MGILSPQQFTILKYLCIHGKKSGYNIRDYLELSGIHSGKPAYYLLIGRMHTNGLVGKKEKRTIIQGQSILEHEYYITEKGLKMLKDTLKFYRFEEE